MKHYSNNWITYAELTTAPKDMTESLVLQSLTEATGDRGHKVYELSNHLGNVLATVSDKKLGQLLGGSIVASYYEAQVQSASDYYPFGWGMPGRKVTNGENYRYSFNGVEQDQEWHGGQSMAFEFRTYDPRVGRFLSVDPLAATAPYQSGYLFAANNPVLNIDYLGLVEKPKQGGKKEKGGGFWAGVGRAISRVFMEGVGRRAKHTDPEKKYLDSRLKIDMSNAPDKFTAKKGGRVITTTLNAYDQKSNHAWYWSQVRANNPDIKWSKSNEWRMDRGYSPKSDPTFREQFPQFADFKNQTIEHHHINHGKIAHGLPSQLHRGKGYTKLWHIMGKASKVVGPILFLVSVDALASDPISGLDPTGVVSIVGDEYYERLEQELFMAAMSGGEESLQRYMSNCLSCGEFGVFYGNSGEINTLINGGDINIMKSPNFFVGNRILGIMEANNILGTNDIINGVIYLRTKGSRDFTPMGIISLPND